LRKSFSAVIFTIIEKYGEDGWRLLRIWKKITVRYRGKRLLYYAVSLPAVLHHGVWTAVKGNNFTLCFI
jgi:hypothetical protein